MTIWDYVRRCIVIFFVASVVTLSGTSTIHVSYDHRAAAHKGQAR